MAFSIAPEMQIDDIFPNEWNLQPLGQKIVSGEADYAIKFNWFMSTVNR